MTEIPEDIMKAAAEAAIAIWKALGDDIPMGNIETVSPIAAALLAERKRCANIAKPAKRPCDCGQCDCRNQAASEAVVAWEVQNIIHQSIMKGGEA